MEQSLSSELLKRMNQWPEIQDPVLKTSLAVSEMEAEEAESQAAGEEEENPALEGHFLTERTVVDVAVIDSCQCRCHRDQTPTVELNMPFSCSKCSQQFCCKCQFLVHRDFHRGERKYTCQVCSKSYYYKSDLMRHQPVHSNIKPHMCKVCGRSFNQVGHLITHRLVHTGEKPFPCDVCNKPFNRKSNLQKHKMIHTGERPFMCLVCGSRFSRKGDLQRHTMLHTGERPYKCELCDKSFSQKPHLLSHQSVHTGERPYKCLACGKSFNRKSNLIKHQVTKCPALSLKRSDGSDLTLSDLGAIPSSSFFSQFNHLIVNKVEITDSNFETLELKPVIVDEDNDEGSVDSTSLPEPSVLRARLSNPPPLCLSADVLDVVIRQTASDTDSDIITSNGYVTVVIQEDIGSLPTLNNNGPDALTEGIVSNKLTQDNSGSEQNGPQSSDELDDSSESLNT